MALPRTQARANALLALWFGPRCPTLDHLPPATDLALAARTTSGPSAAIMAPLCHPVMEHAAMLVLGPGEPACDAWPLPPAQEHRQQSAQQQRVAGAVVAALLGAGAVLQGLGHVRISASLAVEVWQVCIISKQWGMLFFLVCKT